MQKTISSINVRLEGLQEKLKNYKEGNQMIMEEEDGLMDTSNRVRVDMGSLSSLR